MNVLLPLGLPWILLYWSPTIPQIWYPPFTNLLLTSALYCSTPFFSSSGLLQINRTDKQTNHLLTKRTPEMILIYGLWTWLTLRWDWSIHGNPLEQDSQWWLISVLLFLLISRWCPLLLLSKNWKASMCAPKLVPSPCSSKPPNPSGSISYLYHNSILIIQNSEQILQTHKQNHIKGMYREKSQTASMDP